jgi:MFS family permease
LDLAGAATLVAGIAALLFAVLHRPGEGGLAFGWRAAIFAAAVGSLALFVHLQNRRAHPLVPPSLFRRIETAAPFIAGVLLGTTIFGVDTFVPLFVQGARGGTAGAAGAVVTPLVLMWALTATLAAKLIVRFGFRFTARLGASLSLAGLVALAAAAWWNASVPWISAACALVGMGLGPSSMSQVLAVQSAVSERERGVATALVPFFRTLGGSVGVGALGGLLAMGLLRRLGPAAENAGRLLVGGHSDSGVPVSIDPAVFRLAIERSLLPVFGVLVALAVVNVLVTAHFPERVVKTVEAPAEKVMISVD